MTELVLDGGVVVFHVHPDPAAAAVVAARLREYFPPAITPTNGAGGVGVRWVRVVLQVDPALLRLQENHLAGTPGGQGCHGHPELPYTRWHNSTAGTRTLLPRCGSPHLIQVAASSAEWTVTVVADDVDTLAVTAVRVLRQLMIRSAERAGAVLGHAASVVLDGKALVLAGRSGAGKSTIAMWLAHHHHAGLCAADRLLLLPSGGRRWRVLAVPVAWRLAPGTITAIPPLRRAAAAGIRPRRGWHDGKHEYLTSELASQLDVDTTSVAELAGVVVLDSGREEPCRRVAGEAASRLMCATLTRADDALFTSDWFGLGIPGPSTIANRVHRIAGDIPILRTGWTRHDQLPEIAAHLAGYVRSRCR